MSDLCSRRQFLCYKGKLGPAHVQLPSYLSPPPDILFQIYQMDSRGKEAAGDVTEAKVQSFVDSFLAQVKVNTPRKVRP